MLRLYISNHRTGWGERLRGNVLAGLVLLSAVLGVNTTAHADPATQPATQPTTAPADPRQVGQWFNDLASSDAAVRDAARAHLMRLDRADLPALMQLVRRHRPLAPAQAASLRPIVEQIFLTGEPYTKEPLQGFLGIMMEASAFGPRDLQQPNDNGPPSGVVITDRFPGFCAARSLHDGDVVLGTTAPAETFNSPDDLKIAIGRLQPGSLVRLQVLRRGRVIEVPLTLDCKPAEVDSQGPELFRRARSEKFDQYWRDTFAPLLKESVG